MTVAKRSGCKVNLLLNVLGRRPDGFHELETVIQPIALYDELTFAPASQGIELTCSDNSLPTDSRNLVHRAASFFFKATNTEAGVKMHLEKRIPLAAGLGGGSGNAAIALQGLNELFGRPLGLEQLCSLAASLGSDVPFFLQNQPALATGRGERIESLGSFPALNGAAFLLVHPGFGIASAWAYQQLQRFPEAVHGRPGRAHKLISLLRGANLQSVGQEFYNSLEAPAFDKYPLLAIFTEFFRDNGAAASLMSGSGSTTFAVTASLADARQLKGKFEAKFGSTHWTTVVGAA
ncbi:MAG TPA: 4-(cytidine 5'-diphospho)-2-C-methyl-D-erythritol kinase [Patescibacteria group bacterium]|nr:4-(cytidine 5'-diphospho)-2-C-methyl-D-erythritol kinase [Patescibacteria group bacterium]